MKNDQTPNNNFNNERCKPHLRTAHLVVFTSVALFAHARCANAAEDAPTATLIGGQTLSAELKTIEPNGDVRFSTLTDERIVARDELVRWGNPADAAENRLVLLADGSEIAALPWSVGRKGESLRLQDDTFTLAPTQFEPLSIPRHLVRAVALELPVDRKRRDQLLSDLRTHDAEEDAVLIRGGDRLNGKIQAIDAEAVSIETSLGPVKVPLESVVAILFESALVEWRGVSDRTLVGTSDGSLVLVREFGIENDHIILNLDGDVTLRGGEVERIVSIQPLGRHVTYLSDLEPLRFVHVPYLDLKWPLGRDANVLGGRLRARGRLYSKGLGVRSAARIVYRLDGSHERFAALAAVDDSAGRLGSVVFRVLLAEDNAWREACTSPVVRGGDDPVPISVPLGDAKGLALVVDYADWGDELDHADWLDARLE